MKTSWSSRSERWCKTNIAFLKKLRPHLFFVPHPKVKSSHPLSSADCVQKHEVPVALPNHNPRAQALHHLAAKETQANLFALQTDMESQCMPITSDDLLTVLDSGASMAISNDKNDFVGHIRPVQNVELKGIASGLQVTGFGITHWNFIDEFGETVTLPLECALVPDTPTRLLPPQQLSNQEGFSDSNGSWIGSGEHASVFFEGHKIQFAYDANSNLPVGKLAPGCNHFKAFCAETSKSAKADITAATSDNLSDNQRTLLRLHHRLGHRGFSQLKEWSRKGMNGIPPDLDKCASPMCAACQHGSAKMLPHNKENNKWLVGEPEKPGDFVSVDQMMSGSPGLIPFTSGRQSKRRHQRATPWVDHYSRHLHATCQESTSAKATLESKTDFKTHCRRFCVNIKHVHSNNGVFHSKAFRSHCEAMDQMQTFSGVGAHWQNGVVERHIGIMTTKERTMLLHAMSKWNKITPEFWTFAFQHAVCLHNVTPRPGEDKCPCTLFTDKDPPFTPGDFRTFGCPVCVLDKRLQDGSSTGKWNDRSYQGIYIGHSPNHASNVIMVCDPATSLVSPQHHCVFDEDFLSVTPSDTSSDDMDARIDLLFSKLFSDQIWEHSDSHTDAPGMQHLCFDSSWDLSLIDTQWRAKREHESCLNDGSSLKRSSANISPPASSHEGAIATETNNSASTALTGQSVKFKPLSPSSAHEGAEESYNSNGLPSTQDDQIHFQTDLVPQSPSLPETNVPPITAPIADDIDSVSPESADPAHIVSQLSTCMSSNDRSKHCHIAGTFTEQPTDANLYATLSSLVDQIKEMDSPEPFTEKSNPTLDFQAMQSIIDHCNLTFDGVSVDGTLNPDNPMAFAAAAAAANPDILTQSQMLKEDDCEEFVKTQVPEIKGLVDADIFEIMNMSDMPKDNRLLNAIWSYRRKRQPDGTLLKHKPRICVDGSRQQHGVDYWNTCASICHWSAVRLMLVLSAILGLESHQIDCTQAFPQAPLDDNVFIGIPQGFHYNPDTGELEQVEGDPTHRDKAHCIKLKRNLCRCKQAACNWFLHLKEGLLSRGFIQSMIDPCLFVRNDAIIVLHTDDCCFFAPDQDTITKLRTDLQQDFLLTDEGDIKSFLGVQIKKCILEDSDSVEITVSQPGLIDQIIKDVGSDKPDSTGKCAPAPGTLHPPQESDHPCSARWNCRSIIGKLNFLAQNTRPDTQMAVHQCARFVSKPQLRHQEAVKCLVRHLLLTCKRRLIFIPQGSPSLDAHVDSDFAGMWSNKTTHIRDSAASRTGCVISCFGCPVHWVSKLQSEIAFSSTKAEHIALSMCMRGLIPMRTPLFELTAKFRTEDAQVPLAPTSCGAITRHHQSTAWEDNAGCLELAMNSEQYRPRTKHIGIKWHHFRDQISKGAVVVKKIDTLVNWADILTKPLTRGNHERI